MGDGLPMTVWYKPRFGTIRLWQDGAWTNPYEFREPNKERQVRHFQISLDGDVYRVVWHDRGGFWGGGCWRSRDFVSLDYALRFVADWLDRPPGWDYAERDPPA
jgi:hypothetical protein